MGLQVAGSMTFGAMLGWVGAITAIISIMAIWHQKEQQKKAQILETKKAIQENNLTIQKMDTQYKALKSTIEATDTSIALNNFADFSFQITSLNEVAGETTTTFEKLLKVIAAPLENNINEGALMQMGNAQVVLEKELKGIDKKLAELKSKKGALGKSVNYTIEEEANPMEQGAYGVPNKKTNTKKTYVSNPYQVGEGGAGYDKEIKTLEEKKMQLMKSLTDLQAQSKSAMTELLQAQQEKNEQVTQLITDMSYRDWETDRKSTRLNSSHSAKSRMPSSA